MTTAEWIVVAAAIVGGIVYQMEFAPVTVQSISPTRQTIKSEVMGTGTLEARISTTISPKIAGRIGEVLVDQEEKVQQGQLLVRLDDEELQHGVGAYLVPRAAEGEEAVEHATPGRRPEHDD